MGSLPASVDATLPTRRQWTLRALSVFAALFGAATVMAGGRVLFGDADAGHVVGFVLWFNFLAGFIYLVDAWGLWLARRWAAPLALAITIATGLAFMGFGMHVVAGGEFETRTVLAMSLRTLAWAAIAGISAWLLSRRSEHH
jgi:hypothetical protein